MGIDTGYLLYQITGLAIGTLALTFRVIVPIIILYAAAKYLTRKRK